MVAVANDELVEISPSSSSLTYKPFEEHAGPPYILNQISLTDVRAPEGASFLNSTSNLAKFLCG